MLRRQTLIALGVALVLGVMAVYLANVFLNARERAVAQNSGPKIAVAAVPLDYGTELTADKVRFIAYPAEALPAGSFATPAQLLPGGKRRVVLRPIAVNEPILASKISGEGQGASIAAMLPDGKRAVSVRIDDVSGVAGFVQPNDAVDVLITRQIAGQNDRETQVTDLLLQNVRVIAMGQNSNDPNGKPQVAKTATLEVSPVDAQKLALGQEVGSLNLALRKPGSVDDSPMIETVSLDDLRYNRFAASYVNAAAPVPAQRAVAPQVKVTRLAQPRRAVERRPAAPRVAAPPAPRTRNVEVVRGTTNSSYEVGDYGG